MTDGDGQPHDGDGQPINGGGPPIDGTREITGFVTYMGQGFAAVRAKPETGEHPVPTPASNRRYLRDGLPDLYRDDDFTMRFVGALEHVLDPVVGLLDTLPAHFDPELAPVDTLALATGWLGLRHNESQPASQLRELVRSAGELGRLRGTHAGVELALKLNFPDLALRIEDGGRVLWTTDGALPDPDPPAFVVYCDSPISKDEAATIVHVIEAVKPAHVTFRLRVKGPKRPATEA
jgi:phage tail-like protein